MTEAERLADKHRRNGLLLDSNLFVLLLIGSTNESRIAKFDRTHNYSIDDFRLLKTFTTQFDRVVTTPHVLAEVSNLANINEPELHRLRTNFRRIIQSTEEFYAASREIALDAMFPKFGLTDAAIGYAAASPVLVLTDDFPLYHYLTTKGHDAINFNHIRPL